MSMKSAITLQSVCKVGTIFLYSYVIRPLRVGSLGYPECYRNLGASSFLKGVKS